MVSGHSSDTAHTVNASPMVGINLSDGRLIPLNKLHIYLRKRKSLILEWRRDGIEDLCFTIDSNSLQIWSEDVRGWIKQHYSKKE